MEKDKNQQETVLVSKKNADETVLMKKEPQQSEAVAPHSMPTEVSTKMAGRDLLDETDLRDDTVVEDSLQKEVPLSGDFLESGTKIRDRFVIVNRLGAGGMGAVYRALDLRKQEAGDDDPFIAIKVLRGDFQRHSAAFVTLQREAKKTNVLAHPNIVTVYDFDRDGDLIYLTMEELKGAPLNAVLSGKTDVVLGYRDKLKIIDQIAKGLSYAHAKGLVHSDLKPENVFYTNKGDIKILDFGIARAANKDKYIDSFDAGQLGALTLAYASLEMINHQSPHPSDDIYALGIIAYELFNGSHPYGRQDAKTVNENNLSAKPFKVKNPLLRNVLTKSIAVKRQDRVKDATSFLKRFHRSRNAPKRLAMAAFVTAIGLTANAIYIQTIEPEEINFSDLPIEQQEQFKQYMVEYTQASAFANQSNYALNDMVVYLEKAFEIHKTHKDIVKAKKEVLGMLKDKIAGAKTEKEYQDAVNLRNNLASRPVFSDLNPSSE